MKTLSILKAIVITVVLFTTISCSKEEMQTPCTNCPPPPTSGAQYELTASEWVSKGGGMHTCTFKNLTIGAKEVTIFLHVSGVEILINPQINYMFGKLGFYFNDDLVITYQKMSVGQLPFKNLYLRVEIKF